MSEKQTEYLVKKNLTALEALESGILDNFPVINNFQISMIKNRIDERLIKDGTKGHLALIIGPMYSGKTTTLIKLVNQCLENNFKFQTFKLDIDRRYEENKINSHDKKTIDTEIVFNSSKFSDKISNDTQIIFIDEIQFFDAGIISHINKLIELGKIIICTGLNLDFKKEAFNLMRDLLPISDYIEKLNSVCYKCHSQASLTQRLIDGKPAGYYDPIILVGAENLYKPVCRSCHEIRK